MNDGYKYSLAIGATFIWVGFVCAISFMEAWLKFQAPGVTLPIGLGIGRLVFGLMNKVELFLAFAILLNLALYRGLMQWKNIFFFIPLVLVLMQSVWVLPMLDARAQLHIDGKSVPSSNLHFYYVGMEAVKLISLLIFGIRLLIKNKTYGNHKKKYYR